MAISLPTACGLIFATAETFIGRTRRATAKNFTLQDRHSLRLLGAVIWPSIVLAILAANFLPAAQVSHYPRYEVAGLCLFAPGIALRWYSIWILGRFFTVNVAIASDHRLIETGPYRYLRHPSYTGALLAFTGLGLCMGNFVALALMTIPVFFVFRRRMEIEEEALIGAFGTTYRAYMQQTKRLVPFVY